MSVTLLTEQHLELLSLKGGFTGLSESTLDKMPHCWKSHVAAQMIFYRGTIIFLDFLLACQRCVLVLTRLKKIHQILDLTDLQCAQ